MPINLRKKWTLALQILNVIASQAPTLPVPTVESSKSKKKRRNLLRKLEQINPPRYLQNLFEENIDKSTVENIVSVLSSPSRFIV